MSSSVIVHYVDNSCRTGPDSKPLDAMGKLNQMVQFTFQFDQEEFCDELLFYTYS